jgi:hypothetical protein
MPKLKQYKDGAHRQREHLLRRRLRILESPESTNFYYAVLQTAYAEAGHDVARTMVLPFLKADDVFQMAHRGSDSFREFFERASKLPLIELNRTGREPLIRIRPIK